MRSRDRQLGKGKLGKGWKGKAGRNGERESKDTTKRNADKEQVKVVPLAPGGPLDCLERLGLGFGVVHQKEKEKADQEAGLPEEPVEDKDAGWKDKVDRLIDIGKTLDWPTQNEKFWREVPGRVEVWKMPGRDVWLQQHLKIRTKLGEIQFLGMNPAQEAYSRECAEKESKRNIVLKARQMGITSYIAARFFVQTITRPGTLTMLVAHDREAAEEIFRIVHRFWDNLEDDWRTGPLKTSHRSARELVFPRLDSEFTVTSADENAGRGRTIQNLHCTEVSRWGRAGGEALASLRAALVPGGEIVLESTANGAWGQFYEEWQRTEETGYTKHFFPWWYEESYKSAIGPSFEKTVEEAELAKANGLTDEQMLWRRRQWAALRGMAVQEFAEDAVSCFRASGECFFDLESVDKALLGSIEPSETRDNERLKIWLPVQPGREYVIGADPAGGGADGDYACGEVIDRESGMQCAEVHGHWVPREFAGKLAELGKEYNGALLAVESNNHGNAVLACLEEPLRYGNVFRQGERAGWLTTSVSRPAMIENLSTALIAEPWLFRSERLLNECRTFVRMANGNCRAAQGTNDDCVMAMAIAWGARKEDAGRSAAVSHQPSAIRKGE